VPHIGDWSSDVCSSDLRRGRPIDPELLSRYDPEKCALPFGVLYSIALY
jgi:hypothetical protein